MNSMLVHYYVYISLVRCEKNAIQPIEGKKFPIELYDFGLEGKHVGKHLELCEPKTYLFKEHSDSVPHDLRAVKVSDRYDQICTSPR